MPLVRCPKHGRVYDDAKAAGCSVCMEELAMPRAPGGRAKEPVAEAPRSMGGMIILAALIIVGVLGGAIYWYSSTHNAETRASAARDSLRAEAAGPPQADTTHLALPGDLSPVRRARALRGELESLLHHDRGAILGFAAGSADTTSADRTAQKKAKQYVAFAHRWQGAIDRLTRGGTDFRYQPGVRLERQMDNVTNQLQAAASVMRDMVRITEVKPRAERSTDVRDATGYLNSAGSVLSGLPR
ncbi:MAG TPA: hypothetical protein VGI92_07225 [Gemmatimonadales bacterium]